MSNKELITTLKAKREALRVFRFSVAGGKVKNVKEGRNIRRDIARTLTALAKPTAAIAAPVVKAEKPATAKTASKSVKPASKAK